MSKKAHLRKAQERADEQKVGIEKLREKLDETGYEDFLRDVKERVRRVYAIIHALNLEDVIIRNIHLDLVLWRVECLFQIGTGWENTARYTCLLSYLFELDNEIKNSSLSK